MRVRACECACVCSLMVQPLIYFRRIILSELAMLYAERFFIIPFGIRMKSKTPSRKFANCRAKAKLVVFKLYVFYTSQLWG